MSILTLTTDFGLTDPYVAATKGAILSLAPSATLVDVSHDVPPQDLLVGAYVLRQAYPFFPPGTVHLVVIDPGVGTERSGVIVRCGEQVFVGPDNGVVSLVLDEIQPEQIVVIDPQRVAAHHGRPISATFHGRDVFGPTAALLSLGTDPLDLGDATEQWVRLGWARPLRDRRRLVGHVVYIDRYGNLISNIDRASYEAFAAQHPNPTVWLGRHRLGSAQATYGHVEEGDPVVLFSSGDLLEIAVNTGSAAALFDARRGTQVWIDGGAGG